MPKMLKFNLWSFFSDVSIQSRINNHGIDSCKAHSKKLGSAAGNKNEMEQKLKGTNISNRYILVRVI